jgi:phosphoserine phosphatase RsbU/P
MIEASLRSLAEGVVVADATGRFVLFNPAAERLLGMGLREVEVEGWSETYGCFHPDAQTPFPSERLPLARALRGETSTEVVFIRNQQVPDGVWISITGTPLQDGRGLSDGGVVVFRDISAERLAAERERVSLRQKEELVRLSNAVEQTADAIVVTDREGQIEYVNPAFETITGFSRDEALGKTPRFLRSGKEPPGFHDRLWKTILAGEVFRGSPVNRKKNGDLFCADQTITPIKDDHGQITHFVSVIKDATDRMKFEQQDLEMRYARDVQQRLFPVSPPQMSGLDVAGASLPALATCGDYYDYIPLADGSLALVIADVSGHGLGPALIMSETRAYLRSLSQQCARPCELLTGLNATLYADLDDNRYVSLVLAYIDRVGRRACFVNAGHVAAYHIDGQGTVKAVMESCGPPLGMMPDTVYTATQTPPFEDGDVLVFLTDGVTESENEVGDFLGIDATLQVVSRHIAESAADIVQHLQDEARRFAGTHPQLDDITVVVCKVGPATSSDEREGPLYEI